MVKIEAVSIRAKAAEAKIGEVNIPVYRIKEAYISDAFAALEIAIEKASNGVITPNFIIQNPREKLTNTRIT